MFGFIPLLFALLAGNPGNACNPNLALPLELSCAMPAGGGRPARTFPVEIDRNFYVHGHERVDIISVYSLGNILILSRKDNPLLINGDLGDSAEDKTPRLPEGNAAITVTYQGNGRYLHSASNERALECRRSGALPGRGETPGSESLCGFKALLRAAVNNLPAHAVPARAEPEN